jgi:hypothetical protein
MVDSLMVEEIFNKLNNIQNTSNIIPILSVIAVAFIGWYFTYKIHKRERKDKYLLSLVKEKFEASQAAYNYSVKFYSIIQEKNEFKLNLLEEAKKWFDQNNLYLYPEIREDFESTISKLYNYSDILKLIELYKTKEETVKKNEQYQKLDQYYKDIVLLNRRIQENIDVYYKI